MRQFAIVLILSTITPVLVSVFVLAGVCAQQPELDVQRAFQLLRDGKYLAAETVLSAAAQENPTLLQELACLRSFVGDYQGALEAMDQSRSLGQPADQLDPKSFAELNPVSAVDEIIKRAAGRQIVILNEAHHVARHRAFALQLALRLREQGFTYFAAETLAPFTSNLNRNKYPDRFTGHYTQEPMFGCLIRQVMNLGYEPISYEQFGKPGGGDLTDQINSREESQCQNLIRKIFEKNPDAKVFIYVGYRHADEKTEQNADGRETAWLAARLARETGIDPLTIDQTTQTERSRPELCSPEWRSANEKGWLTSPVILVDSTDTPFVGGAYKGRMDLQVFHPPAQVTPNGRPDWLEQVEGRKAVAIPAEIQPASSRILVQAFLEHESEKAIPFDQIVLDPDRQRPKLILQAGSYRLIVQDEDGKEIQRQSLIVD